jgi:Stage II sporulation protein E (SpoIIE)/GAF domain
MVHEQSIVNALGHSVPDFTDVQQDRHFARALTCAVRELGAFVAVVFVAQPDEGDLVAAAVGGSPPAIFSIPDRIPCESPHASATAWRTGRPVESGLPFAPPEAERSLQFVSYPYSVIAIPLGVGERRFGSLTALWVPPCPSEIPRLLERLAELGEQLECALLERSPREEWPRPCPMIVPVFETMRETAVSTKARGHRWGLPELPASSVLSQMYHLHKLSAALNRASGIDGVVREASEWIMKPFGASTLVVVLGRQGRLRVVGHDGSPGLVRAIHGAHLDRRIPAADALRTNKPLFLPDRETLLDSYSEADVGDLRALAVLPVTGSGHVLGSFMLGFDTARDFPAEEQALLLMMATHLTVAVEREYLNETEHALTDALQRKLLPRSLPEWSEFVVTARYLSPPAASGMGGDWYDVIPLPDRQVGLVVGDVEGHNADSAVIMGQLRSGLHAYAAEGHDPADVLARSSALLAELDADLYATCCFVRVDLEFGGAEVALAGHPPPYCADRTGRLLRSRRRPMSRWRWCPGTPTPP